MIETDRLLLKPVSLEDLDIYEKLLTCPETTKYLPGGKPFSLGYIENYVSQKVEHWSRGFGTFIIILKDHPDVKIGYAGVEIIPNTTFNDVRYAVLPNYQGRGYALEATRAVIDFTFRLKKQHEIFGVAVSENVASIRLLEKLGMSKRVNVRLYDSDDLTTMSISCS